MLGVREVRGAADRDADDRAAVLPRKHEMGVGVNTRRECVADPNEGRGRVPLGCGHQPRYAGATPLVTAVNKQPSYGRVVVP